MKTRFSIVGLMGVVALVALGLVPLTRPSLPWAGGMLLITCGVLAMSIVGVVALRGIRRIQWLGFALFGWGYLFLSGCSDFWSPTSDLPTSDLVIMLGIRLGIIQERVRSGYPSIFHFDYDDKAHRDAFFQIAHCLFTLLFAGVGWLLAGFLFKTARPASKDRPADHEAPRPSRSRGLGIMIGVLVAAIVGSAAATVSTVGDGIAAMAGITLLLTCGFHGISLLAAIVRTGRARSVWLGAALFGIAYTVIIFSRPTSGYPPATHLATEPILNGLRGPISRIFPGPKRRVWRALDRSIPLTFPDEVSLKDLVDYIKRETAEPNQPDLPIFVDPIGLQEAERSMNSTITIDLEGLPLRTILPLALNQIGLAFVVKDGFLHIISEDSAIGGVYDPSEYVDDPFQIVGNCLLSLIAAGFGALAGLVITRPQRGTSTVTS